MRVANLNGRATILRGPRAVDVAIASGGRFGPDPGSVYDEWAAFRPWAEAVTAPGQPYAEADLGPVVPRPRQVFAIGLNYSDHAAESGLAAPAQPMVFTKFASSLTGPQGEIALPSSTVDWEVELVAVIGRLTSRVAAGDAWGHVAGLAVGQDLSDREVQMRGAPPQFSLGKSFTGFGPVGPWLTTVDELTDPDDLALECLVNGEVVQSGRTDKMIFSIPEVIAYLSGICTLHPGDLIFTGTPPGVGMGRNPPRYLSPGDVLVSRVEGLGELNHTFVSYPA